eukprot:scaffold781_cov394-Prasinococcus_capsulatus_cf.AAC.28
MTMTTSTGTTTRTSTRRTSISGRTSSATSYEDGIDARLASQRGAGLPRWHRVSQRVPVAFPVCNRIT